jgi:hypothetical protein
VQRWWVWLGAIVVQPTISVAKPVQAIAHNGRCRWGRVAARAFRSSSRARLRFL